jgi:hypothetical protein
MGSSNIKTALDAGSQSKDEAPPLKPQRSIGWQNNWPGNSWLFISTTKI